MPILKYDLNRGICGLCGHIAKVRLFRHRKFHRYGYFCSECAKELDDDWIDAEDYDIMMYTDSDIDGDWGDE